MELCRHNFYDWCGHHLVAVHPSHFWIPPYFCSQHQLHFLRCEEFAGDRRAATVVLLWVFLGSQNMGLWGLILAPGLVQLAYQNWKWPSVVIKELWSR